MSYMRSSDLSREMTLRNAGEHRRLEGHIKTLDSQLKQNLVSLQAEILEVKASRPYARTRSRSRSPASPRVLSSRQHQYVQRIKAQDREENDNLAANGRQRLDHKHGLPQIQVSSNENLNYSTNKSFLPQINADDTWLVSKGSREESLSPPTHRRRAPSPAPSSRYLSATPHGTNLYRPRSSPNLFMRSTEDSASSGTRKSRAKAKKQRTDLVGVSSAQKGSETVNSRTHTKSKGREDCEEESTGSSTLNTSETKRGEKHQINANVSHDKSEETHEEDNASGNLDGAINKGENGDPKDELDVFCDEDLFRNSLLLKASREEGLTKSLKSLGFTDFNEVIDQRLRQLQEELPSEEEMRKIRYLRFRDEPPPPHILSVFEKDSRNDQTEKEERQ